MKLVTSLWPLLRWHSLSFSMLCGSEGGADPDAAGGEYESQPIFFSNTMDTWGKKRSAVILRVEMRWV